MGGEIKKEPAGLSPASLYNLGYVATLLEPLGARKDKPHLPRPWEDIKGTWVPSVSSSCLVQKMASLQGWPGAQKH